MAGRMSFEFDFLKRVRQNEAAKAAIGAAAAGLIADGQSVLLDSGTTTLALAPFLHGKQNLTVITTSLPLASQLQYDQQIAVLLLGGYVHHRVARPGRRSRIEPGDAARRPCVHRRRRDRRPRGRLQPVARGGAGLTKMAAAASRVYVVADHSKLGKPALWRIGHLKDWNRTGDRHRRRGRHRHGPARKSWICASRLEASRDIPHGRTSEGTRHRAQRAAGRAGAGRFPPPGRRLERRLPPWRPWCSILAWAIFPGPGSSSTGSPTRPAQATAASTSSCSTARPAPPTGIAPSMRRSSSSRDTSHRLSTALAGAGRGRRAARGSGPGALLHRHRPGTAPGTEHALRGRRRLLRRHHDPIGGNWSRARPR